MSEKLEELISLLYQDKLTQFGKRQLVEIIDKLQKKNEELCKLITEGIEIKINSPYENYFLEFMKENFIPIQNIKEKIEELNKLLKEYEENNMEKDEDYFFDVNAINAEIQVLQELLEK